MSGVRSSAEQGRSDERDRELRSLRQQHKQQLQDLQQIIQFQASHLVEKDQTITQNNETIAELRQQSRQLEREKGVIIEEKERELRQKVDKINRLERQLGRVNQQLEESERVIHQFQRRIAELEQLRPAIDISFNSKEQRANIKLTWREGEKAPYGMRNSYCAAVDGSTLYVRRAMSRQMYTYTISTSSWSQLPDSPTTFCPSVVINNNLTLVGGFHNGTTTSQLFSLTENDSGRRWTEEFPPMPTKRWGSTALCIGTALIVAGGKNQDWFILQTVEVLDTETLQWSTATDLPKPLSHASAAVCGDQVYILGKANMYTCSVLTLIHSCKSFLASIRNRGTTVWKKVAVPPVTETTCVSIHGRLLAVGGDSIYKSTTAIHMYNPTTDSWEVISHMMTPRYYCIAAVLSNNRLMVVGGYTSGAVEIDSVEFATVD